MTNKKNIFILFLIVVLALLALNFKLQQDVSAISVKKVSDQFSVMLRSEIDKEKENALRYALLLSRNDALIQAMENEDEEKGYLILSELMQSIEQYTHTVLLAQIITHDYLIFARSWDNSFAGMPIDEYRPDLQYFLKNKKPRSAIEVGRRLGIKATVPIYKENRLLGFVEVLQFFEKPTEYFRKMGVELYILMDEKYYNISIFMQQNPFIGDGYVVANRHYNAAYLKDLEQLDMELLKQEKIMAYKNKYFLFEPMMNGAGENIGAFVMVIPKERMHNFAAKDDELSFLINFTQSELYEITKKHYLDESGYKSPYDKELIYLKDVVAPEDKEFFMQEARERLQEYSKDELIGIILGYKTARKIDGEIQ